MRLKTGLFAFVVLATGGCSSNSRDSRDTTTGCASAQASAECFVADFYKWYGPGSKNMNDVVPERGRDLAPRLRAALGHDRWVQEFFPGDEVGLSFDPFINGQDWCGTFGPEKGESRGDTTLVPVFETCRGKRGAKPSLIAEVVHSADGYQFANLQLDISPSFQDLLSILARTEREQFEYFYATKGCPFECCRYGDWTLESDVVLHSFPRAAPGSLSDSIGVLRAGLKAHADSGLVLLTPPGIAIVTNDSLLEFDSPPRLPVAKGDTLFLLNHLGEGHRNIRWRDTIFSMDAVWDSTGARGGARLVRAPKSSWWVHFTDGQRTGWVEMTRQVRVKGSDACG